MQTSIQTVLLAHMPSATFELAAWLFREWGYRKPDRTLEDSILTMKARANVDRLPMALIAVADGKPVGTGSLVEREDPGDEPGPWISGVYVLPQFRGRKIATVLIRQLEREAIQLGCQRLLLSAAAPKLYRRLQYKPTGATKHEEAVMLKELDAAIDF